MVKVVFIVNNDVIGLGFLNIQQIHIAGMELLCDILSEVPGIKNIEVVKSEKESDCIKVDAFNNLSEEWIISCIYILKGEPKLVREALNSAMNNSTKRNCYCVICAPYISDSSAEVCKEFEAGYFDLSGNCMLKHNLLYVKTVGNENRYKDSRKGKSVFQRSSVKSSIILRTLLNSPDRIWKHAELAAEASVSIGQAAKVKGFLEEREFIENTEVGFRIINPLKLILEWGKIYNTRKDTTIEFYTNLSVSELEMKFREFAETGLGEYYLTGFSACARYNSVVKYKKLQVYVPYKNISAAAKYIDLKRVDSGSKVSVIVPYDGSVVSFSRVIDGFSVVSPIQACLDVSQNKAFGESVIKDIVRKEFKNDREK